MHTVVMEVMNLAEELAQTKRELVSAQKDAEYAKRDALDALKKEIEKSLIESDIKREVAIAKLDAYEKMISKDDFNKEVREMLKLAIQSLGSKQGGGQQPKQQQG